MYDAIVIGARCAGSPTAMLLARMGHKVLLVDRARFPSDTMRNHVIRQTGVVHLHRWGLLDKVIESGCPPMRKTSGAYMGFPFVDNLAPVEGADAEYGPRRLVLDKILIDAAAEAGAEVREGFSVSDVMVEDGRVTGIKGKSKGGVEVTERARIVIGADGQHSIVARTTNPPSYNERPVLTCGYYSYWSNLPSDCLEVWVVARPAFLLAFPTNFGLTCVATQVPVREFASFRKDIEGYFMAVVDEVPALAERVRAGRREEHFVGSADLPNRFLKPYGPGWALVGDAGYVKDPITARGISNAFQGAQLLADAADAGLTGRVPMDEALARYEQQRNESSIAEYEEACTAASFLPGA